MFQNQLCGSFVAENVEGISRYTIYSAASGSAPAGSSYGSATEDFKKIFVDLCINYSDDKPQNIASYSVRAGEDHLAVSIKII